MGVVTKISTHALHALLYQSSLQEILYPPLSSHVRVTKLDRAWSPYITIVHSVEYCNPMTLLCIYEDNHVYVSTALFSTWMSSVQVLEMVARPLIKGLG